MMSSSQFVFLDLSEIGEEDYEQLVDILDEKKCDLCLPAFAVPSGENLKEVGDSGTEDGNKSMEDEDDVLSQTRKDSVASGISFFVDGGLPEDIDLGKTPPMLSASATPPPLETFSTPCDEPEDFISEDPIDMYPPHTLQHPYMNHPMTMLQSMNVHSAPTSGPLYNMTPPYPPHSAPPTAVQNGLYPHLAPNPPHHAHHLVPHTVHIENCHVNLSPYGNHPQPPHGPVYAHASPYQGAPHHQVFQSYVLGEQPPMAVHMKGPCLERDYDPKRHEPHSRGGGYSRVRGRGRGRRKGRDDLERSNSVSSDHSSYSDSGGKPHYKDPGPPPHVGPTHFPPPLLQYPPYVPYAVNSLSRPQQGFPLMPQGYLPDPYCPPPTPHVLTYSASVAVPMMPHEGPSSPPAAPSHSECDPPVAVPQGQIQEHITVQVTSITTHASYMEAPTTSHITHTQAHYPYPTVSSNVVHTEAAPACMANVPPEQPLQAVQLSMASLDPSHEEEQAPEMTSPKRNEDPTGYFEKGSAPKCEEGCSGASPSFQGATKSPYCGSAEVFVNMPTDKVEDRPFAEEGAEQNSARLQSVVSGRRVEMGINELQTALEPPHSPESSHYNRASQPNEVIPSRESSPPTVSLNNKCSLVPFSTSTNGEKDVVVGAAKTKTRRKNSPHNKDASSASSSTTSSSRNSPSVSFEAHNSITIYNKSLTRPPTKDSQVSKAITETRPSKAKGKVENDFTVERQPLTPSVSVGTEPQAEKKVDSFVSKETHSVTVPPPLPATLAIADPKPKGEVGDSSSMQAPSPKPSGGLVWGQKKCWSQLFKTADDAATKQVAFVSPFNAKEGSDTSSLKSSSKKENDEVSSNGDVEKGKLGALLKDYVPNYRPVLLQPRGLINKNYWCYVNAPLQALLACPSFYQLAETLSKEAGYKSGNVSTPFINSIVDFVSEFSPMGPVPKTSRKKESVAHKKEPEIITGISFEPTCVYKMLINCKENQFTEGRQQDAEEMLSCVLNGLHEEMVESLKLARPSNHTPNGMSAGENGGSSDQDLPENQDEWKVQGPKKKSCITRTAHYHPSPISEIFWGQLRSVLHQAGNTTANLQPFNTLPLDIHSSKVDTLKDALSQWVTREEISGFTCPKTNQEVTASNQVLFEELPRVLILQLKRFIYDKDGGLQKVTKRLQFPIDLDITKDLISMNSRGKFSASQRKFKLFAIINHEGKEATKGHYVADVYHNGYACWLRYDDSNLKAIPENVVLRHEPPRVPYLLFYRRSDTLSAPAVSSGVAAATIPHNAGGKE